MCIIVYKPAGKRLPSENILKNCFINNPDGAGIMIKTEKGIQIQNSRTENFQRNLEPGDFFCHNSIN